MKLRKFFLLSLIIVATTVPGRACYGHNDGSREIRSLSHNWKIDLAVTSVATVGWVLSQSAMDRLAPLDCRWCSVNGFDDWGHRNIRWSNPSTAGNISNVTAYALAPLTAFGLDALAAYRESSMSEFAVDAMVIAEAVALSSFTTQLIKFTSGRQRPYAHYGNGSTTPDDNTSFYSGHTSLAFSLAVASGTVASMRGYSMAPWIWGSGMAIAATTAYLRVASDKHYLTDAIAGAIIGSAFGFGIPYLFHRPKEQMAKVPNISVMPAQGGAVLCASGRW